MNMREFTTIVAALALVTVAMSVVGQFSAQTVESVQPNGGAGETVVGFPLRASS